MLLIGSHALQHHIQINRNPVDYDVICTFDEFQNWINKQDKKIIKACYPANKGKKIIVKTTTHIFEFEIAWENNSAAELLELTDSCTTVIPNLGSCNIASLDVLYTLKMSHRFKKNSPHFLKTMRDIKLMRQHGAKIPDFLQEWFKLRQKETYDYSHPNLNQSKQNFFDPNSGVNYVYDHDSIHESMKHLELPAYSYFKEDLAEVKCSKDKFFNAPEEVRLFSVLEESYVLALERSQIPFRGGVDPRRSFLIALEKVCTSITSGWWREYAWDHYDDVLSLYNDDYVEKFWKAVNDGKVKSFNK